MFHGGYGEMTAEDVKFSYERFITPAADGSKPAYADDWGALDKVEVTGKYTGRILFKNPAPAIWVIGILRRLRRPSCPRRRPVNWATRSPPR